ncbi:MAG: hypothetical protein HRS50_02125 [Mycoplasmataceae bacterium]|nr:hypothetical protein [Mycoplasmataceae bacterium]
MIEINDNKKFENNLFYILFHLMILNTKTLFKNGVFLFSGLLLPIIITLGFSMFLPIWFGFTMIVYTSTFLSTSMTFGSLAYSFSDSTLKKNLSLTRKTEKITIASVSLSMLLTSFISIASIIASLIFFEKIGWALTQFSFMNLNPIPAINWNNVQWLVILYYWFILTIIMFAFSIFLQRFIKAKNGYYIFILTYLLLTLFIGGTLSITWTYVDGYAVLIKQDGKNTEIFGALDPFLLGTPMWIVCQFFPTFHINQIAFNSVLSAVDLDSFDNTAESGIILSKAIINVNSGNPFNVINSSTMYKYYFFMPYVYIFLYYLLFRGAFLYKK